MQQSSATPKNLDVGIGLRKIVACSHSSLQCLLVSTVFGTVSSLHPTSFLMIFILVSLFLLSRLSLDCSAASRTYVHVVRACVLCARIKTEVVTFYVQSR